MEPFKLSLLAAAAQALINCPILDCAAERETMVPGICFQHDGNVPTKSIQGRFCPESEFCPFSYVHDEY